MTAPVLELAGVAKNYGGLRPLRIQELVVRAGESVALVGFDRPTAETLVNLVTGATLPDSGAVTVFGRPTRDIDDSTDWLSFVDRFGIVSERAVLLEPLSVLQNLAMPFTLDIDPLGEPARARAAALAGEVGLSESQQTAQVAALDAASKARVRVARALALDPRIVWLDHATSGLEPAAAVRFGGSVRDIVARRGAATIAVTADEAFARAVAGRVLQWDPASGRLRDRRSWLGGRLG